MTKSAPDATSSRVPHEPMHGAAIALAALPLSPGRPDKQHQHAGDELHSERDPSETKRDLPPVAQRTCVARRREASALLTQVDELESQLDALRRSAGLPTREDKNAIESARTLSATLDRLLHANGLFLGRLDSILTNELLSPPVNPLSTFIHFPRDMDQRRAILRGMQDLKLRRGIETATEWLHHLDHTAPFLDEKGFTTASGEYHYDRFQIDQFPNFRSARELYNTFDQFLYNMEISVTAGLGQFTLREDSDDTFDPTIWNPRFVTIAEDVGVPEELNCVYYAQFYPRSPYTNSPMGIIVLDTVNIDDLYPYVPEERTCKDIQAVHMVYETLKPGTPDETIAVFKLGCFGAQLPPRFEVAPGALAQLQRNFPKWPSYMFKYLHNYVAPNPSV